MNRHAIKAFEAELLAEQRWTGAESDARAHWDDEPIGWTPEDKDLITAMLNDVPSEDLSRQLLHTRIDAAVLAGDTAQATDEAETIGRLQWTARNYRMTLAEALGLTATEIR